MSQDSRGVRRGGCEVCGCVGYDGGRDLKKCVSCGHPPGRHVNLDNQVVAVTTSPASISMQPPPATQADANVSHGGPFNLLSSLFGLFATKKTQSHHIMDGIKVTPATGCAARGCNRPVDFDANTGKEYACCREHHGSVNLPPLACVQVQDCEQDDNGLFGGGESLQALGADRAGWWTTGISLGDSLDMCRSQFRSTCRSQFHSGAHKHPS